MSPYQRTLFGLVTAFAMSGIGWRGGRLLIALGALDQHASQLTVGILAASGALLPLMLSVYAGRVSDRVGSQKPIIFGSIALAGALVLPALMLGLPALLLCALALGFGQIFIQVSAQNGVGLVSTPQSRSRNYATLQVGASISNFIGPLMIGATVDHFGLKAGFALVAAVALLITVPAKFLTGATGATGRGRKQRSEGRMLDLLAHAELRRVMLMSGVAVCGIELFAFYIPIYGKSIDLSATMIGAVLAAHAVAMFTVRLGMGLLLRMGSEVAIARSALFIAAAGFAIIPIFRNLPVLFAIAFLLGLGLGVSAPLTQALAYNSAPEGRSGEALGMCISVNKMMQIAVPLTFGSIGTAFGVGSVFLGNALVLLTGALISMSGRRSTPPS